MELYKNCLKRWRKFYPTPKHTAADAQEKTALFWHNCGWMWLHGSIRLPQADLCHALGVQPQLKYESEGGLGLADIAAVLRGFEWAYEDLTTVLTSQVL